MNDNATPSSSPADASGPSLWQSAWVNTLARFAALLVVFGFFAVLVEDGRFYTPRNLENIARQSAVYATAALGMTLVIITAGIDLSVGSMIALTVIAVASVLNLSCQATPSEGGGPATRYLIHQWPTLLPILAVVGGILAATLAGMVNGVTIVGLRLAPETVNPIHG